MIRVGLNGAAFFQLRRHHCGEWFAAFLTKGVQKQKGCTVSVILQCIQKIFERDFGLFQDVAQRGSLDRTVSGDGNPNGPVGEVSLQTNVAATLPHLMETQPTQSGARRPSKASSGPRSEFAVFCWRTHFNGGSLWFPIRSRKTR